MLFCTRSHNCVYWKLNYHLWRWGIYTWCPVVAERVYSLTCLFCWWSTGTTTAWTSSATMNCWTPLLSGRWQRATRLASAWKTPPVTMDTTGDMPARHTHRSQYKLQFFFYECIFKHKTKLWHLWVFPETMLCSFKSLYIHFSGLNMLK